jgi:hypothetical protein
MLTSSDKTCSSSRFRCKGEVIRNRRLGNSRVVEGGERGGGGGEGRGEV